MAHNGVLFLDELPEFQRNVLECLRQPLEDRKVVIGRATGRIELPASILLAASANPCPCGYLGSQAKQCTCTSGQLSRYRGRLSGPLLDRIDMQIFVPGIDLFELRSTERGESSAAIRARVEDARRRQRHRLKSHGIRTNAEMSARVIRETCPLDARAESALRDLYRKRQGMSARAIHRIIKVARTIADVCSQEDIDAEAIVEAAGYRSLELSPIGEEIVDASERPSKESISVSASSERSTV